MKIIQTYSFQNKKEVGGGGWRWGKSGGGGKAGSCNNVNINNFLNKKQQGKNSIFLNGEMQYIEV